MDVLKQGKWTDHGREWAVTAWIDKGCDSPSELWDKWKSGLCIIGGEPETCPKTGRPHWQLSVQTKKTVYRREFQKMFRPGKYYSMPMYSEWRYNKSYCGKGGMWEQYGTYDSGQAANQQQVTSSRKRLFDDVYNGMSEEECWTQHRESMPIYWRAVQQAMKVWRTVEFKPTYSLDQFKEPPITDWTKTIILHGPAGIGKTQYALAHFKNPLLMNHNEDLRKFKPKKHDGIVFDDMSFEGLEREVQLAFVENELPKTFSVKFGDVTIPGGTKKIMTTNRLNFILCGDAAIDRRTTWLMKTEDLRQMTN